MTRICLVAVLGLASLCLVGCGQSGSIYAAAPAGGMHMSYIVPDGGQYTLFHVTRWSAYGEPIESTKVVAYNLHAGEKLGFDYVTDRSRLYAPDAALDVEAYAGGHRTNLGPIVSTSDRYFWADANGWDGYWNMQPVRTAAKRVTLQ